MKRTANKLSCLHAIHRKNLREANTVTGAIVFFTGFTLPWPSGSDLHTFSEYLEVTTTTASTSRYDASGSLSLSSSSVSELPTLRPRERLRVAGKADRWIDDSMKIPPETIRVSRDACQAQHAIRCTY